MADSWRRGGLSGLGKAPQRRSARPGGRLWHRRQRVVPSVVDAGSPSSPDKAYKAFLSYSHAVDGQLAPSLQQGLHRFARPWYRIRAVRVFRDQTSLSATPDLWSMIEAALAESEYLILLASPDAAQSDWVNREAEFWKEHRSTETILLAVTDGELEWNDRDVDWGDSTAIPPVLRRAFSEEPLYVDLRWARSVENLSSRNPRFRDCLADLAAPLHGRSKDELIDEDVRQHRRTSRLAGTAITAVLAFGLVASVSAWVAIDQRRAAVAQAEVATSLQLAAQAVASFPEDLDRGLLLAIESHRTAPTRQAVDALLRGILFEPRLQKFLHVGSGVATLAFSPDGRTLASGSVIDDGGTTIRLWDLTTERPVARALNGHTDTVRTLAFSGDGRTLASGSDDTTVRTWDLTAEDPVGQVLPGHEDTVWSVAFSPGGGTIASGSGDKTVRLWDLPSTTGEILGMHTESVRAVAFSRHGVLASGGADKTIRFWDPATRQPLGPQLDGHEGGIEDVEFDSTGDLLATGGRDQTVRIWSVADRRPLGLPLKGHGGDVNDVAFSPDGRTLASGSSDQDVRLWEVATGNPVGRPLHGNDSNVHAIAFDPDSSTLAAGDGAGAIILWDPDAATSRLDPHILDQGAPVAGLTFSPDATLLASGGGGAARLWDTRSGEPRHVLVPEGGAPVTSVAFTPDGTTVVGGTADGQVVLWDVASGQRGAPLTRRSGHISAVAVSRQGLVAASGFDGSIVLLDLTTGRTSAEMTTGSVVTHVAFSDDGRWLAATGADLVVWDMKRVEDAQDASSGPLRPTKSERVVMEGFGASAAAFAPDGLSIAVDGEAVNEIAFLSTAGHEPVGQPFTQHTHQVTGLAFDATGGVLASASADGTAILWDVESAQPLGQRLSLTDAGGTPGLRAIALGAEGSLVAVGDADGRIALWDVGFENLRDRACIIANRNLRPEEQLQHRGRSHSRPQCPGLP